MNDLDVLQRWFVAGVAEDRADLTARQMAVLLTVYRTPAPHTVRGLAKALNVSKPAITRATDRLSELDLVRRKVDPADRRSVLLITTLAGTALLRKLEAEMRQARAAVAAETPPSKSAV